MLVSFSNTESQMLFIKFTDINSLNIEDNIRQHNWWNKYWNMLLHCSLMRAPLCTMLNLVLRIQLNVSLVFTAVFEKIPIMLLSHKQGFHCDWADRTLEDLRGWLKTSDSSTLAARHSLVSITFLHFFLTYCTLSNVKPLKTWLFHLIGIFLLLICGIYAYC